MGVGCWTPKCTTIEAGNDSIWVSMKPDNSDGQMSADLAALSVAAAHGIVQTRQSKKKQSALPVSDGARQARIEDLKAKYEAGALPIDEKAVVTKLVDSLFENRVAHRPDDTEPDSCPEKP